MPYVLPNPAVLICILTSVPPYNCNMHYDLLLVLCCVQARQPRISRAEGTHALILVPTRELAVQVGSYSGTALQPQSLSDLVWLLFAQAGCICVLHPVLVASPACQWMVPGLNTRRRFFCANVAAVIAAAAAAGRSVTC
jgi:hypothetical protein